MRTFLQPDDRARTIERLWSLTPDAPRLWGTMSAPQMIAHLRDQMKHTLGLAEAKQIASWQRNRLFRYLAIYVMPWPKGRIKGPPDAFVTQPGHWEDDLAELVGYIEEFAGCHDRVDLPPHARLGPMSRDDWGAFCWKHFDHHLRQFGV